MTFRLLGAPQALAAIEQMRRLLGQTGQKRDISPMQRELDHLRSSMRGISQEIASVVRPALGGFTLSLSGIVLGLSAAAVGLNKFAGGLVQIKEGADRVGMTIQQYRGFMDAAARVNIAKPEAIQMMENFNKVVYEAKLHIHGTWEEIVRLGGADVVGSVLNAKNQVDQMAIVWQRLEELKKVDPAKVRAWAELWFNNIKAARIEWNEAMEAMARASGMTDQQIADAKRYHDEWIKASLQWDKLKLTVGTAAMQALDPLVKALTQALQNKEAVTALAEGLNRLTAAVAGMTPDDVSRLGKSIGEFVKGVGEGLGVLAKGLTGVMDFIDRTEKRRGEGKSAFGTYDVGKGRLLTDEEEAQADKADQERKAQRDQQNKDGGPSFWSDFGNWWRNRVGLPVKETGENAEKANVEFQQLVEDMRKAQGGGGGGSAALGAGPAPGGGQETGGSAAPSSGGTSGGGGGAASSGARPGPRVENVPNPAWGASAPSVVPGPPSSKGEYNYFQKHGVPVPSRESMQTIKTAYGPITVNPEAAPDFAGFFQDLSAAGAPLRAPGSYNKRQKRWGGGWSSHAYGAAVDLDDQQFMSPAMQRWLQQNPDKWNEIKQRYNIGQPLPEKDPAHMEWKGPHGSKFDSLTAGKTGAAASGKNVFDISIDASAMKDAEKGVARIPSTLFNNGPQQTPTMPATGKQAAQ
ncbi:hypothetical protein [Bradyrhizobium sp. BRP23]|uniref:hypothetical protein n=1 Tax=Bradyrhizobium sp. BRP23 TaxID=2793820 RepID=UPI001CD3972E|nr:hypothetical protein [Bradyrhizobium sp. BRP23]MCA1419493.1 hypothetical protein [Bradyrhizobium sp. BRP23]